MERELPSDSLRLPRLHACLLISRHLTGRSGSHLSCWKGCFGAMCAGHHPALLSCAWCPSCGSWEVAFPIFSGLLCPQCLAMQGDETQIFAKPSSKGSMPVIKMSLRNLLMETKLKPSRVGLLLLLNTELRGGGQSVHRGCLIPKDCALVSRALVGSEMDGDRCRAGCPHSLRTCWPEGILPRDTSQVLMR